MTNVKSFLSKTVRNNIIPSENRYKIAGLKCNANELPESLYFALVDGFSFKLPYLTNKNIIIEQNIHKNINLVSKILSYFEVEELDYNEDVAQKNKNYNMESIIPGTKEKLLNIIGKNDRPRKLLKSVVEYILSDVSRRLGSRCPIMKKMYSEAEINNYISYFDNNSSSFGNTVMNLIETGAYLNKNGKVKKGYPLILADICNDAKEALGIILENIVEKFALKIDSRMFISSDRSNYMFGLLANITEAVDDVQNPLNYHNGRTKQNYGISIEFCNHYNLNEESKLIDFISVMFSKNFKFLQEFEEDYIKLASSITNINDSCVMKLNIYDDNYSEDICPTIKIRQSNKKDEQIEELRSLFGKNLKLYTDYISGKYREIEQGDGNTVHSLTVMVNQIASYVGDYIYDSCELSNSKLETISLSPIMYKEPECSVDYIAKKFKDCMNLKWSDVKIRKVKFSMKKIKDDIRHRYFFPSTVSTSNFIDQKNLVVDTIIPETMYKNDMSSEQILRNFKISQNINTKTAYAISPFTSSLLGCKLIPIEHLCRILGYTKDNIKDMLNTVKERRMNFVFVGAGGTCNNTAIWLSRMIDMCNLPFLFEKVFVFEKDSAELHNMLRFPTDPYTITIDTGIFGSSSATMEKNKCNIIAKELRNLSKLTPSCYERYIAYDDSAIAYPTNVFKKSVETEKILDADGEVIDFQTIEKTIPISNNTIFYGAPDIITRQNLSNIGNFISATHASNSCNVYINPEQDAMIQVESYGMIQLTPFFMNQLRMTIALLEILSNDNYLELLSRKDYEFLAYSFNGESVLKNDRVYNFKIIDNPEMATEEQAETATEF